MISPDRLEFELLIPGLLGLPGPPLATDPPTPTLDRLLAHACRSGTPSDDRSAGAGAGAGADLNALIRAFGLGAAFAEHLPTAPYCLSVDDPTWDRTGFWLHADPVHLRADRDQLRLFDSQALAIQPDEARQLVAELNDHFRADGLALHAPVPERWYLRTPAPVDLHTQPLQAVMGSTLAEAMPSGADARRWNALMNEAQMLMHQSAVNQARSAAGRAMINGLWLSGPGAYTVLGLAADLKLVIAEDPLPLGLARAGQVPTAGLDDHHLSERLVDIVGGRVLLIESRLSDALLRRDLSTWEEALQRLDSQLAPIAERVLGRSGHKAGKAISLRLHDGAGLVWTLNPAQAGGLRSWLGTLLSRRRSSSLSAARASLARR